MLDYALHYMYDNITDDSVNPRIEVRAFPHRPAKARRPGPECGSGRRCRDRGGLYQCGEPEDGTVVAHAGPDSLSELADEVMNEANKLGVALSPDVANEVWPDWSLPA